MFVNIQTFTGVFVPVHGMFPVGIGGGLLYWAVQAPFGVPAAASVADPPPGGGMTLSTCSKVAQNHVEGVVGVRRRMCNPIRPNKAGP
jgi:hypothetical protein